MNCYLQVPQGRFELRRFPVRKNETLQAWDAADEYLLQQLSTLNQTEEAHVVIVNDSFGALAVALQAQKPTAISDSFLSQQATRENLRLNGFERQGIALIDSLGLPSAAIDTLLIKIPKTLALLEYQLHCLRPFLKTSSLIIAAGMVKNMPPTAWKLIERLIGPTRPSLAVKKARLLFVDFDPSLTLPSNPYPVRYQLEHSDWQISNHANVFSRDSLDIGTRFLLQHLPNHPAFQTVVDLGCGNGVVGLMLAKQMPQAQLHFVDESFMAIASARENFMAAFCGQRQASFSVGDGLSDFPADSVDCIVCNPPFHQQHTVGDHIAWQMFQQAHRVLRQGGELRIIGNRHLNYHLSLKKLFGHWDAVASNAKFVILKTVK